MSKQFCPLCGNKRENNATFCAQCGYKMENEPINDNEFVMNNQNEAINDNEQTIKPKKEYAEFGTRLIAYIIDAIIIGAISGALFWGAELGWFISGAIAFGYYVLMEMNFNGGGQTIGKKVMKIRTVDQITFEPVHGKQAAIHAVGKSFFLPIDLIIGLFAQDDKKKNEQIRLTQILAETVVIRE